MSWTLQKMMSYLSESISCTTTMLCSYVQSVLSAHWSLPFTLMKKLRPQVSRQNMTDEKNRYLFNHMYILFVCSVSDVVE